MIHDLTAHIAKTNGLGDALATRAVGIVLNGADRQGAPLADIVFRTLPGARALAARTGSEIGAPVGDIARLIEQTPGGRRRVARATFRALQDLGLSHHQIAALVPAIGLFLETEYGIDGHGQLGDFFVTDQQQAEVIDQAA